jgi:hypothetical protein
MEAFYEDSDKRSLRHVRYVIAMPQLLLMIGTRKGAFLASSAPDRRKWDLKGPFLKGSEVHYVAYLAKTDPLISTVKSWWFGPGLRLSTDRGETWTEPERITRYLTPDESDLRL